MKTSKSVHCSTLPSGNEQYTDYYRF